MALQQEDIKKRGNRLHGTGTVGDNFDAQTLPICRVGMVIMTTHVMTVNNLVSQTKTHLSTTTTSAFLILPKTNVGIGFVIVSVSKPFLSVSLWSQWTEWNGRTPMSNATVCKYI